MVSSRVLTKVIRLQEKTILGSKPITNEIHGKTSLNLVGPGLCPRQYQISLPAGSPSLAGVVRLLIAPVSISRAHGFLLCFGSQSVPSSCGGQQGIPWRLPTCDTLMLASL